MNQLTIQETKVMKLVETGKNNNEIASILSISKHSVKALIISAKNKLKNN